MSYPFARIMPINRYPFILACVALVIAGVIIAAQKRERSGEGVIAFKNFRIIDGKDGAPVEGKVLVIRDGKILSIEEVGEIPEKAEVVDGQGKILMPTLIAAHSHLGVLKGTKPDSANVTEDNVIRQLGIYGRYGIGTVVSLGADGEFIYRHQGCEKEISIFWSGSADCWTGIWRDWRCTTHG